MTVVRAAIRKPHSTRLPPIPKLAVQRDALAAVRTPIVNTEKKMDWHSITNRLVENAGEGGMPANLRIVPYEPKDARYHGICATHRELYEKLRKE